MTTSTDGVVTLFGATSRVAGCGDEERIGRFRNGGDREIPIDGLSFTPLAV